MSAWLLMAALATTGGADCPLVSGPLGIGVAARSETGGGIDFGWAVHGGPLIRLGTCERTYLVVGAIAGLVRYAGPGGDGPGSVQVRDLDLEVLPVFGLGRTLALGEDLRLVTHAAAGPMFLLRYVGTEASGTTAHSLSPALGVALEGGVLLGGPSLGLGLQVGATWPDTSVRLTGVVAWHYEGLEQQSPP